MTTGEIILNIALAIGVSASVAVGMTVVPNHDRIRSLLRFRFVAGADRRESADGAVELSLAK